MSEATTPGEATTPSELACADLDDHLHDFVGGGLSAELFILVESHCGTCPDCTRSLTLYRATIHLSRAMPKHEDETLPAEFGERLRKLMTCDPE